MKEHGETSNAPRPTFGLVPSPPSQVEGSSWNRARDPNLTRKGQSVHGGLQAPPPTAFLYPWSAQGPKCDTYCIGSAPHEPAVPPGRCPSTPGVTEGPRGQGSESAP